MPNPATRVSPIAWTRRQARRALFHLIDRIADTDDGRSAVARSLGGLLQWRPELRATTLCTPQYADLGCAAQIAAPPRSRRPIFITARFRSGSTLLWHLFRQLPECTAYYEPFNERRWFDPAVRGAHVDRTHRNVDDYWREYDGLEELGEYYSDSWIGRRLYMSERDWHPAMQGFVDRLIARAPGRPVLQFNHIDFRLPWFRRTYPDALLVHLYRHPRDQWWSTLMDPHATYRHDSVADFVARDKFYLLVWAQDLKHHFPFLDPATTAHPYQLFYYVWKLSYLFGAQYADHSVMYESLVQDPRSTLAALFDKVSVDAEDLDGLVREIVPPSGGRWKRYADEEWFREQEAACERVLRQFIDVGGGS
jgi:hypothetical protein